MTKEIAFYDFEVFPNFWLVKYWTESGGMKTIKSTDSDYMKKMLELSTYLLCGYNIKHYDMKIMHAIIHGRYTPQEVKTLSDDIINHDFDDAEDKFNNYFYWQYYVFTDLFDDRQGSLKEFEANLGVSIEETEVDFNKEHLTEEDILLTEKYCEHDVMMTKELFNHRQGYISGKLTLADMYNIPTATALKSTNGKLVAKVLKGDKHISMEEKDYFKIPFKLHDYIHEYLPKDILEYFLRKPMKDVNKKDNGKGLSKKAKTFHHYENDITLGIGGVHSTIGSEIAVYSNDDQQLYDIDVSSYYPNLMIHYDYLPRTITGDIDRYSRIYELKNQYSEERSKIKKKYGKSSDEYRKIANKREATKLVLNGTYGVMKNQYNSLYDPDQGSRVCILGQMLLIALSNQLYTESNCRIIHNNTDGILVLTSKDELPKMQKIVSDWEKLTNFVMDWGNVDSIIQKDVNNYIWRENKDKYINGDIKFQEQFILKGGWVNQAFGTTKNLNAPISQLAIVKYYTEDIPVEETIRSCTDIKNFCFTCKTGHTYEKTIHFTVAGENVVGKYNRVIATTDKRYGELKKMKFVEKDDGRIVTQYDKMSNTSEHVKLVNDKLDTYDFDKLDIDFQYYIDLAESNIYEPKIVTLGKNDLLD